MPRILYLKETTYTLLFSYTAHVFAYIKLKVVTDKQSGVLADEQTDRWIDK